LRSFLIFASRGEASLDVLEKRRPESACLQTRSSDEAVRRSSSCSVVERYMDATVAADLRALRGA
jgi:hypothetical protein